ncbi:NAD(P)-binding protein [Pleurostoma richardsiae]|uniref:NAD(P)-binding protein n=1 Tax=Pleurostoma richardsiae TaxID=41990 RepID=A0AA38VVA4_9PEZI|nr:NAD(P)-binding protein [Pleurostoma richardsiae]
MTTYHIDDSDFASLWGKTILLTGCATGIGRQTAYLAHKNGANLILGDWLEKEGQQLAEELKERVIFRRTDVSSWDDLVDLFAAGWAMFQSLDAVLANAAINEVGVYLEDTLDPATGRLQAPNLQTLSVNLLGQLYTTKLAMHYFGKQSGKHFQLVLTGSAACFLDTPPLHVYGVSKAGVMGLMRSLRTQTPQNNHVTVNMVAPWLTKTPMLKPEFLRVWGDLPANEPIGVAKALLLPIVRPEINGKSFFIAGHEIIDFEEGLEKTQPLWMGEKLSKDVEEGQRRIVPRAHI